MKAINFLDVTLNLTTRKYQPYKKPDDNPLYINILSNHPPNIIKNLPSNISKRINTLSAYETTFNKSKDLYNNVLAKSGFKHKITFQKQQNTSAVTNKTKNRKRKVIWFNPPFSLNFSTNNTFLPKRLQNILSVNSLQFLKVFHNTSYCLRIAI